MDQRFHPAINKSSKFMLLKLAYSPRLGFCKHVKMPSNLLINPSVQTARIGGDLLFAFVIFPAISSWTSGWIRTLKLKITVDLCYIRWPLLFLITFETSVSHFRSLSLSSASWRCSPFWAAAAPPVRTDACSDPSSSSWCKSN